MCAATLKLLLINNMLCHNLMSEKLVEKIFPLGDS